MCDTDAYASDVAENPDPEADADADALCGDELAHSDEAESDIRGVHEHNEVEENQSQHVDHNSNLQNGDQDEARNHLQVFAQPLLDVATVNQRPHPNPNPEDAHAEDNNDNDQIWPEITRENNRIGGDGGLENASIATSNSECLGNTAPEDEILEYPIRNVGEQAEDFEPECDQTPVICDDNDCECMNDDEEFDDDDDDDDVEEEEEDDDSENLLEPASHQVRMEGELMNVCYSPADMNVREASIVYCESDESESGAPMAAQRGYESPEFSSPSNGASQQENVYKVSNNFSSLLVDSNSECSSDETTVINFNQMQTRGSHLLTEPVANPLPEKDSCASIQSQNIEISQGKLLRSHSPLIAGSPENITHSVYDDQLTDDIEVGQDATSLASQSTDNVIVTCSDSLSTEHITAQTVAASLDLSVSNNVTHGSFDQTNSISCPADCAISKSTTDTSLATMTIASSPESGIDSDHSKTPTSNQTPTEDQLLSELEAELDTPKPLPLHSSLPLNGMAKIDLNQLPEFLELKKKLQLANTELAAKEVQIKQLETKVLSQTDQIEVIKMERNSYRKELDTCQGNDLYLPQIKALENSLVQKDTEIRAMKDKLAAQEVTAKRTMANMQSEHKAQMDQMAKMCEDSKREKESMVMKFAQAEHKGLDMQKTTEKLETRLKDVLKDKDILLGKLSSLRAERQKIVSRLDNKASEYSTLQRDLEKQKELVSTIENRMKWTQNKLSAEIESHKETKVMLQTANTKLKESKEECEQIRRDCQDIIKTYQESEEIKSNSLDNQLKAKESELKVQEQEKNDQQEIHSLVVKELESLKVQHKDVLEELKTMKDKVTCLEDECRSKEDTLSKFKDVLQNQKARIKELRTRLKELEDIKSDYDRGQEELSEMEKTLQEQKQICKDIEADIESCKKRESELLELTSNLSAKNAQLQSDNITVSNKVLSLEDSCNSMKLRIQELETKSQELHHDLIEEKQKRQEETTSLAEQLHDKTKAVEELSVQLEEEKDDVRTLKRKHANNIKDLTRQLTQSRRKLETYENTGEKDSTSLGSRTSSNGSLNTLDSNVIHRNGNPDQEYPVITEQVEVDKQVLIERIVKLQKSHARKSDKIEFMEDHINHLIDDIQRKKRIIQSYALREEVGVLAPEYMDKNKAVLSRKGGIMASLYNSQPADQSMTLDLSLEINSKLQSVLEDTLLKNITLKDSLDTLGKEIARLSQENRQLQLQLQNNK